MNDLRIEDKEQQAPYAGLADEPATFVSADVAELRSIVLWLSKNQWPRDPDETWEQLVEAHAKAMNPDPLPELPSRAYRVGR